MIRSVGSSPWRMTVAVVIFILVLGGYMSAAGIVFAQDVKISVFVGANGKVNDNADDFVDVVSSEEDYKLEIIADDDHVIGSVLVNDESLEKMNGEGESIIGFPKGTLHIEKPRGDLDVVVAFKKAGSDTGTSADESGETGGGKEAGGGSDGTGGNNDAAGGSDDTAATGEGNGDSAGSEGNGDSAGSDDAAGSTEAGDGSDATGEGNEDPAGNEDAGSNDSAAGEGNEDTDGNEDTGSNDSANGEVNRTASNTGNTVVLRDVGKNKTDGSGDAAGNDATETADSGSGNAGNSYQSPKTGDEDGPQLPIVLTMMALAAGAMAVVRRRHV